MTTEDINKLAENAAENEMVLFASLGIVFTNDMITKLIRLRFKAMFLSGIEFGIVEVRECLNPKGGDQIGKDKRPVGSEA